MTIACLGWGSLVWNPKDLPVRNPWFVDGPLLPIEFARESGDKRITLVITPKAALMRSLWALFSVDDLGDAKARLAEREGIRKDKIEEDIAVWQGADETEPNRIRIAQWANEKNIDAVVWTNLPPKIRKENRMPSLPEVVGHLKKLSYEKQRNAEHYIRMAPKQIDTEYRRAIEQEFGWTCLSKI